MPLGNSYSGPIVPEDRVLTTETVNKKAESLIGVERKTGKDLWKKEWDGAMVAPFYAKTNGDWIRSTPATDGSNIVVGGMRDVVACFDVSSRNER